MKGDTRHLEDNPAANRRYALTLNFLTETLTAPARILDLGAPNPMGRYMEKHGFTVVNTEGDLDAEPEAVHEIVTGHDVEAVTAFEILEHLVGPVNVLRALDAPRLYATVPLKLWFASAYRNDQDPWDRHFHEFEDWQFDWLLEHAGWEIMRTTKWTSPSRQIGVRPFLRRITPRYYAVEAVRR